MGASPGRLWGFSAKHAKVLDRNVALLISTSQQMAPWKHLHAPSTLSNFCCEEEEGYDAARRALGKEAWPVSLYHTIAFGF